MDTNVADEDIATRLVEIEKERASLEERQKAIDEYDRNEHNGMSSTDDTISKGRPNSHPLHKLRDRISGGGGGKKDEQEQEHGGQEQEQDEREPPHEEQQQEPTEEPPESKPEPDISGIRTISVGEVNVIAGPHASPQNQQNATNQQQPQQLRALGRQQYYPAYMNTPNVWQYPGSRESTTQVGLVQQSYKSYFGLN